MIDGLNHITITVSDVRRSLNFYSEILGFEGHVIWDSGAYLSNNGIWLCLPEGNPIPSKDYSHIALTVKESEFGTLSNSIINAGCKQWKMNSSEGKSLYFQDPDDHKLEIHVGGLANRLANLKNKPYSGLKWL